MPAELILYSRQGCHLCEDFEAELRRVQPDWGFALQLRDVDARPEWVDAFGDKVPLLVAAGPAENLEISRYFLDLEKLRRYLGLV